MATARKLNDSEKEVRIIRRYKAGSLEDLENGGVIEFGPEDSKIWHELCENPPPPNEALIRAALRNRDVWP